VGGCAAAAAGASIIGMSEAVTRLACRRALVTGATSGLGLAMARALVDSGAQVALTSRQRARAEAAAERLSAVAAGPEQPSAAPRDPTAAGPEQPSTSGRRQPAAIGIELDVRLERSVRAAVDEAWRRLGGLDLLINNAGIGMRTVNPRFMTDPQPFWEVAPAGFRDVFETKATGCFLVAREVLPRMLAAGRGRVITISMNHSTMVRRGFVPYGPAGAAVEALARVIAADLAGTAVTANILLPGGATATGMIPEETPDEVRERLLPPSIMGPPIVWLASAEAEGVHDQRIVASEFDGWLARWRAGRAGSTGPGEGRAPSAGANR
jgi:NAD(P)-dependent dehydrogenase (short-subunit alcohol dehydrogenase family)